MTAKHLLFESAARDAVLRGATAMANAVRITLGPVASTLLLTEATLAEVPEPHREHAPAEPGV